MFSEGNKPKPDDNTWTIQQKILDILYGRASGASAATTSGIVSGATALSANVNRSSGFIQNLGTNPLFIKEGSGASVTDFNGVIAGGTANDDGLGGVYDLDNYTGVVTIAGTSPRYVATQRQT